MILALAFLIGAAFGAWRARRRGGNGWDMAQYGAAHGFAFLVAMAAAALVIGLVGGPSAF